MTARLRSFPAPLLGVVAWSGSGKTTLLTQLLPRLVDMGWRPAVIKHAHHSFDIDHPGKDSYRLRQAGAGQMLVASRHRYALITELPEATTEPDLAQLLPRLDSSQLDLVLIEGFKQATGFPKLVVERQACGNPPLWPEVTEAIAVVCDDEQPHCPLPQLPLNDVRIVAEWIDQWLTAQREGATS